MPHSCEPPPHSWCGRRTGWFLFKPHGNEERTSNYALIAKEFNLPIENLCCRNRYGGPKLFLRSGLAWVMPVWPTWSLGGRRVDHRIYTKLSISRNNRVDIEIHWATESCAESRDEPLAEVPAEYL